MHTEIEKLKTFRAAIYSHFSKRKDAIMNLCDAISSYGHKSRSVVGLSEAPCFERKYSSITDAIADGLPSTDWDEIEKVQFQTFFDPSERRPPCFLTDCTSNPRPFSRKLHDKTITHSPNPAPGNKPICVGHQFSSVAMLPNDKLIQDKKWLTPISFWRVKSDEKGNEVGIRQISQHIKQFKLEDSLTISVGDSLYGSETCRAIVGEHDNLVHIFRLNSKRNLFSLPEPTTTKKRGRKKEYGAKMALSDRTAHLQPEQKAETTLLTRAGKTYPVKISAWENMLLRGSKQHRGSKHPMTLVKIEMFKENNEPLFKRPLWVAVVGKLRHTLSLISIYQYYRCRYNIEHFFRFAKHKILLDAYQTSDVEREENWWKLCGLAYNQLYLANALVELQLKPWEKYLPDQSSSNLGSNITTPSQTQRGFDKLFKQVGTPAAPCQPRGKAPGRLKGQLSTFRTDQPIIYKTQKNPETRLLTF